MTLAHENHESLKSDFLALREQFIWINICRSTYVSLYESGPETDALLRRSAAWFFDDLNIMIINYILLEICKVTDPVMTMGRENLTIPNLWKQMQEFGIISDSDLEIREAHEQVMKYRGLIKNARNRLIGHLDKKTVLGKNGVGGHHPDEVSNFFNNLQVFSDCAGRAIGVGPLDFSGGSPGKGDVLDLLKLLKGGLSHEGN